jgi:bacterioferritin-associated ferredoxin
VCEDKTFASLKEMAARRSLDLQGLMAEEGCATHCGRCRPYLERMLSTGETIFPVLGSADP